MQVGPIKPTLKAPGTNLLTPKSTGLRPLCRKKMASWSAGPKCGNCNHAAESGRRWDEMEGRYQCAVLAPYKSGALDSRMVCFLRHRGLSPVDVMHRFEFCFHIQLAPVHQGGGATGAAARPAAAVPAAVAPAVRLGCACRWGAHAAAATRIPGVYLVVST